jgi:hypothetical protein
MLDTLFFKFSHCEDLKRKLLETGERLIVEARADYVWGSGLNTAKTKRTPVREWKGQNLLGEELMRLREYFQHKEQTQKDSGENEGKEGRDFDAVMGNTTERGDEDVDEKISTKERPNEVSEDAGADVVMVGAEAVVGTGEECAEPSECGFSESSANTAEAQLRKETAEWQAEHKRKMDMLEAEFEAKQARDAAEHRRKRNRLEAEFEAKQLMGLFAVIPLPLVQK